MSNDWGINAALDRLTLTCVGFSLLLLVGLAVVSVCSLRPKGDRLSWSLVAVMTGLLAFGLAWHAVTGGM